MTTAALATNPRVPPQSLEAEEAVLGGILLDNRAMDAVNEILVIEDFYREAHRKIFRALLELDEDREPADVVTLTDRLQRLGELEAVGGVATVAELADRTMTAANVKHYARIVKDKAVLRQLGEVATDIVTQTMDSGGAVDQLLEDAEAAVFRLSEGRIGKGFTKVEDVVEESIHQIEQLFERKEAVTGIASGFYDLDKLTSGFQPGDLIIMAGRPSMGKSALAVNCGQYAAQHSGKAVGVFSLEMSKESIVMRMLCAEARVSMGRVRNGNLFDNDLPRLAAAASRLTQIPFFIDDSPALSVLELRAKSRRLMREHPEGLGLIIVDYLQLMRAHQKVDNREQEISLISRSLKGLAKELHVPVIALSQLNRGVEMRADKRPMMADLRESGAIEQDADVISFIYRDDFYNKASPEEGIAEVIISKQRNGPQGTAKLGFRKELTLFENLSGREEDEDDPPAGDDFAL
ncbi:MAG: replicative DNA helicase [Candidatus Binatia bacterium]|nr:replicative DNA helicase [Candidatus Binatia bacterium]MDG2011042.1 replicative DNA helicase [Candidatus Binatia bacterium]